MVRIRYAPAYPIGEVTHVISQTIWKPGDEKDFDENDKIRVRIDKQTQYVRVIDDLLGSPDFVLAQTNKNPNYTCAKCGAATNTESAIEGNKVVTYELRGERFCPDCYKLLQDPATQL